MKKIFFAIISLFVSTSGFSTGVIVLEGNYQGKNLYIQNPFAGSGVGFCVQEVRVNGNVTTDEIASSAFEIDFRNLQLKVGDKVEVKITHKDAINKNGTLLDEAKKRAKEIVSAYKPTDRFQLFTNDFEGKHQRLLNKEEFTELIDEVKISPATRTIKEISARAFDVLQQSGIKNKQLFLLSDFQKSVSDVQLIKNDTSISVKLIPLIANEKSNVYIDTCWFETPVRQLNQVEKLHVRIKNVSEKVLENNSIKLFINNTQKTPASFNCDKNSETEVVLSFASRESGIQHCRIELNDFPVTFDDQFYFSFEVAKNIPVLTINGKDISNDNGYLNKLFGGDSLFIFKSVSENQIDYASLSSHKLIILNELKSISSGLSLELKRFMENGGSVLVFPAKDIELTSYKEFCLANRANYYEKLDTTNTKVDKINLEHPIYKDVFDKKTFSATNLDLPKVNEYYELSKTTRSTEEYLLKLQNGNNFLSKYSVGKGKLYLSAAGLHSNFSNLGKHALFVPTLYKIAIYSQTSSPLFYTISNDEIIETNAVVIGENALHIKNVDNSFDIIPEHKSMDSKLLIYTHNQISNAGNYHLLSDKTIITGLSFNFNRKESDLTCYTMEELNEQLSKNNLLNFATIESSQKSLTSTLTELDQGKKLWKLCIILALVFFAAEVLLLRFMK